MCNPFLNSWEMGIHFTPHTQSHAEVTREQQRTPMQRDAEERRVGQHERRGGQQRGGDESRNNLGRARCQAVEVRSQYLGSQPPPTGSKT